MSPYQEMVRDESKSFLKGNIEEFEEDSGDHGGKSAVPNLSRWIDTTGRLTKRLEEISARWGKKDILQINNESRNKTPWGDPKSSAFSALYKDILFEIKKVRRRS